MFIGCSGSIEYRYSFETKKICHNRNRRLDYDRSSLCDAGKRVEKEERAIRIIMNKYELEVLFLRTHNYEKTLDILLIK